MNLSIVAKTDTVIKRFTIDSTELDPKEKFNLPKGEKLGINWIRSSPENDHWEFELKSPKGAFFNWYAFQAHVEVNPPVDDGDDTGISSQLRAFLDVIAWTEGTDRNIGDGARTGYNIMFTFARFPSFSDHPRLLQRSGGLVSDAAGRYQFLSTTWDGLGLGSFSPQNQDRGAVKLIQRRGALRLVEAGRIRAALDSLSFEWASLPDSTSVGRYPPQPIIPVRDIESLFVQAGGDLA